MRATQAQAQAIADEAQAVEATAAEAKQRQRAEASEQAAKNRLVEVERQRKQADKNFAAALEAVDRMLTHVDDAELNDIPRVGPLRRKILKDAVAFYERIPLQGDVSPQVHMRVAQTWKKIASLSWRLNENDQTRQASSKAISILTRLVADQPGQANYRATLASYLSFLGKYYQDTDQDFAEAEKALRRASELYAELASNDPQEKSWLIRQAETLSQLARALNFLGKRDEGVGYCARALDLLDLSQVASSFDRAQVLFQMANLASADADHDDYSHRAMAEYRKFFVEEKQPEQYPGQYAGRIWAIASNLIPRYPDEAEKLLDESIALWSEIAGPSPSLRNYSLFLVLALRDQARHQRRLAADRAATENPDQIAGRVTKAETLLQEAIHRQRQMVSRFALREDRYGLIVMLHEEAEYLLGQLGKPGATEKEKEEDASTSKLQADSLLTEAIQLCRQLAAEFEGDADYKGRLAVLLKLQVQHFTSVAYLKRNLALSERLGQKEAAEDTARKLLAACQRDLGEDHSETRDAVERLAGALFRQRKFQEAEPYFRQWVEWSEKTSPDKWWTFSRKSNLGECVFRAAGELKPTDADAAEKKMAEAEALLLTSYQEVNARESHIPKEWKKRVPEALQRLVQLYDAWGKPAEAAKWRLELEAARQELPK